MSTKNQVQGIQPLKSPGLFAHDGLHGAGVLARATTSLGIPLAGIPLEKGVPASE